MRVRLRLGIVTIFLLLMVPLTMVMTGILYYRNSQLATDIARNAMNRATADILGGMRGMLQPVARIVDLSVSFGQVQREGVLHPTAWRTLFSALQLAPDVYSVYFGFRRGEFLQMVRLPPGIEKFGPAGARPPEAARYVVRVIDDASGQRTDSYIYFAEWGDVVKVERVREPSYNPRLRPWYGAALDQDGLANSGIYVFSGIGRPGMTLSHRIATDEGDTIGVFGADLTLDTLATTLDAHRVGAHGQVFIIDDDGRLIGYPDVGRSVRRDGDKLVIAQAETFDDPLVADAVRLRRQGAGDSFRAQLGGSGDSYLVSFTPLPGDFKRNWTVAVIAAEEEFIAPIRRASIIILIAGTGFLLLAGAGVVMASKLLTRPIGVLIEETKRIRQLRLDDPLEVHTKVRELDELANALGSMKSALHSFGAYVPKEVVREIVASGAGSMVGGARQPVSVLFTDLVGFAAATESLEPEDTLNRLSEYFDVMSDAIHRNGGTIDKYIGDAIMALWNAPVADPDHQANACRAMLACREAGRRLNADIVARGHAPLQTRFGLHCDWAVVGNVGSSSRMQYTALGPGVNLASRVEGLNKHFGTELLITGAVADSVQGAFLLRPLGPVVAAGTSVPIRLFELLGDGADSSDAARCDAWAAAFAAYEGRNWDAAATAFAAIAEQWPDDRTARLFRDTSAAYRVAPPPPDWDGIMRIDQK